jgi:hypothetical protein
VLETYGRARRIVALAAIAVAVASGFLLTAFYRHITVPCRGTLERVSTSELTPLAERHEEPAGDLMIEDDAHTRSRPRSPSSPTRSPANATRAAARRRRQGRDGAGERRVRAVFRGRAQIRIRELQRTEFELAIPDEAGALSSAEANTALKTLFVGDRRARSQPRPPRPPRRAWRWRQAAGASRRAGAIRIDQFAGASSDFNWSVVNL